MEKKYVGKTLANRITELRKEKGLTQGQAAKAAGINQTTWSTYETEKRIPTADILFSMASVLDVSLDYLVGLSDNRQTDRSFEEAKKLNDIGLSPDTVNMLSRYNAVARFIDRICTLDNGATIKKLNPWLGAFEEYISNPQDEKDKVPNNDLILKALITRTIDKFLDFWEESASPKPE